MRKNGFVLSVLLFASIALACTKNNPVSPPTTFASFISLEMFVCPDTLRNPLNCTAKIENDSLMVIIDNVQKMFWVGDVNLVYGNLSWDSAGSAACNNAYRSGSRCFVDGAFVPDTKTSLDVFVILLEAREYRLSWELRDGSSKVLDDTTLTYYGKLAPGMAALKRQNLTPSMSQR